MEDQDELSKKYWRDLNNTPPPQNFYRGGYNQELPTGEVQIGHQGKGEQYILLYKALSFAEWTSKHGWKYMRHSPNPKWINNWDIVVTTQELFNMFEKETKN